MDAILKNKIVWKKIGIIAGVYLGMKYLVPLVIPFLIAALIVCGCWPVLRWTRKRLHIKPPIVMAVLLLGVAFLIMVGCYILGKELGSLLLRFCTGTQYLGQAERFLYDCCDSVGEMLHIESSGLRIFVTEQINIFLDHAQQKVLPGAMGGSWQFLKNTGSWVAAVFVTGISVLLLAADFEKLKDMGKKWPVYESTVHTIKGILHSVGGYLKAQAIIMGIVILLCMIGIWISGSSKSPILAGIGIGCLDALPVFGTGTIFVPWILIQVIQQKYTSAVILAITYGVCMLTREFLEPKLIGNRLGILPILILMSVYVGVKIYGAGGILLGPLSVLLIQELWERVDGGIW
ncbi:MAG: AI-2E family transporter [Lachnospiraceae bacterium]|nr:AI-2E family transporter [Lachnospiraceae bacterium]